MIVRNLLAVCPETDFDQCHISHRSSAPTCHMCDDFANRPTAVRAL